MYQLTNIFLRKKPIIDKLIAYGFKLNNDYYIYQAILPNSNFIITIKLKNNQISYDIIDPAFNDSYTLHLVESARGSFVEGIRKESEIILFDIREKCFSNDIFQSVQAKLIIDYINQKYGDELEYLWEKYPDCAIVRRKDSHKWYLLITNISTSKLGIKNGEMAEIIDLHIDPNQMNDLIDNLHYFPGWHMNKKSWYTIILDETIPIEEIYQRIDTSYQLAHK